MMGLRRRLCWTLAILGLAVIMASCVGVDTTVSISADGSGKVLAEYRVSEELIAFGELEANKDLLPIPLSRADVEKSLAGSSGLELKSWSSKKQGSDMLVSTIIAFKDLDALMYYLDPSGKLAVYEKNQGGQSIRFSLGDKLPDLDPDMKVLAQEAFEPYDFKFKLELPSPATSAGSAHPAVRTVRNGNTVSFEGRMKDIVTAETAPSMDVAW